MSSRVRFWVWWVEGDEGRLAAFALRCHISSGSARHGEQPLSKNSEVWGRFSVGPFKREREDPPIAKQVFYISEPLQAMQPNLLLQYADLLSTLPFSHQDTAS